MRSRKIKIIVFILFIVVVIGGGFYLSTKIQRNRIQKTGYKTNYNPNYIDSAVRAKNKHK